MEFLHCSLLWQGRQCTLPCGLFIILRVLISHSVVSFDYAHQSHLSYTARRHHSNNVVAGEETFEHRSLVTIPADHEV